MRGSSVFGGRNPVSVMPSGSNTRALQIRIERLAGDARDDVAEQKEIDVAVDERFAGSGRRHFILRQLDRRVVTGPRMQIDIGTQPRDVRQQVTDRDATFSVPLESRDVRRNRVVEAEASVLDERHHRSGRRHRPWSTKRDRRPYQESSALPPAPWRGSRTLFRKRFDRRGRRRRRRPGSALAAIASRTSSSIRRPLRLGLVAPIAGDWPQSTAAEKRPSPKPQAASHGFWRSTHGANILSRLWFFTGRYRQCVIRRRSFRRWRLVAALVVSAVPAAAQTGRIGGTSRTPRTSPSRAPR